MVISLIRPSARLSASLFLRRFSAKSDFGSDSILVESIGSAGVITINRPESMNSVNRPMMQKICQAVIDIEMNKNLLIIKGIPNCFSSGGDIKAMLGEGPVAELVKVSRSVAIPFKYGEYYLLQFLKSLKIPYVALIDGLTLGVGLGLIRYARYQVATERTLAAMPENKFGYFVDVGASHFLPRLPRNLGIYLGITGDILKGSSVYKAGLATNYVNSQTLPELERSLVKCTNDSEIKALLEKYSVWVEPGLPFADNIDHIEACFVPDTIENIIERLEAVQNDWSRKVLKTMQHLCPGSMKLTLRLLQRGAALSYEDCLHMELRVIINYCDINYDIVTGIRELHVYKNKVVKWNPPTLEQVDDDFIESYFQGMPLQSERIIESLKERIYQPTLP